MNPAAVALTASAARRHARPSCWLCKASDGLRMVRHGLGTTPCCCGCFPRLDDENSFTDFPPVEG